MVHAMTFLLTCLLLVASIIMRGGALTLMWKWFMVPNLNLPQLGVTQMIGISTVVTFLTFNPHVETSKEYNQLDNVGKIMYTNVYFCILFLMAAIVNLFM